MTPLQLIGVEFYRSLLVNLSDHPARPLNLTLPIAALCCPLVGLAILAACLPRLLRCYKAIWRFAWFGCAALVVFVAREIARAPGDGQVMSQPAFWTSSSLLHLVCGPDQKAIDPDPLPLTGVPRYRGDHVSRQVLKHWRMGWPLHLEMLLSEEELDAWTPASLADGVPDFHIRVQHGYSEQQSTSFSEQTFQGFMRQLETQQSAEDTRIPYMAESFDTFFESPVYQKRLEQLFSRALLPEGVKLEDSAFEVAGASPGNLSDGLPELEQGMLEQAGLVWDAFWGGPAGARSGLHADPDPLNLLYQVYGSKTVTLFHPAEKDNLYVADKRDSGAMLSHVDPFVPNETAFPKYANARRDVVHLNAGDALFVPAGWFHFVTSDTAAISISGRLWSLCELTAFLPEALWVYLEELGLAGDTTSHWLFYDKVISWLPSLTT
eukprot:TRINITY_DN15505_c0_g1_i1.p1 TRINITY_DN15505_c0_g1~~TRINITY_DN15505_c0_g1_i1.p1  ORF type:complete len:436 (-),score=91.50 TRINITY_DN15505_c0_g1_i1:51-1358(-)